MQTSMDTGASHPLYVEKYRCLKSGSDAESAEHAPLTTTQMLLMAADAAMQGPAVAQCSPVTVAERDSERMQCQAYDCPIDLRTTKPYCLKKRLCPDHLVAHALRRRGASKALWRFCQQCGKLEPIESFDGAKRSCRARLQKRRAHNSVRSTDLWKKRKGDTTYKGKLQHKQQDWVAAAAVAGEDDYSDAEHDEQQDMVQTYGVSSMFDAGRDPDSCGDGYADHGALEHTRPPGAAAASAVPAAASPRHLLAGFNARNNLQQHQDLYQSLLYSAAMAAATAVAGGSRLTGEPGTHHEESATDHPSLTAGAGGTAAAVPSMLEDALLLLRKQAAADGGGAAAAGTHAVTGKGHAFGLVGGESWQSSCDAESLSEQQHQQLGSFQDAPSPESVAATLAAMASGRTDHNRQQRRQHLGNAKLEFAHQQERQLYSVEQQQATWHSSPLQKALPPPPAATSAHAHKHSLVRDTFNQPVHRGVQHSVCEQVNSQQQGVVADANHQQQQQLQPEATAAVQDMMHVDVGGPDDTPAARGRMPGGTAAAVGLSSNHNNAAKQDSGLQLSDDQFVPETNTQADAAATLAAMRACRPPEPPSPMRAVMSHKQRYQMATAHRQLEQQQQQQQHSAVHKLAADMACELLTAGSSPAQSGSSTHADPAATAAAVAAAAADEDDDSRPAALLATSDRVPLSGPQFALHTAASATAATQPSALDPAPAAVTTPAAVTSHVDQVHSVASPSSAAAAVDTGPGAGNGVGTAQGLGLLLTAGISGLLAQNGQSSTAGVQVLTSIFAQAPGAAATLLLAQQQQLQQLQAQQQQLMEQVELQRQQHQALIEQIAKQQSAAAAAADHKLAAPAGAD